MANTNPTTGIPFGYIRADAIDPDLFDDLCYKHGKDVRYDEELEEHLAQKRSQHQRAIEAGEIDPNEDFDEDFEKQEFAEHYQCDEPVYGGEHEGVKYRTSWLGGAPHLWVFESPVITKCRPCSICVPDAGDLDSAGDYQAYGVPVDWLRMEFMEDMCIEAGFEFSPGTKDLYWRETGDDAKNGGPFGKLNEAVEDCYKRNLQREVTP